MDDDKDIIKLKNSIALKTLLKTFGFTIIAILVLTIMVDVLYNDELANDVSSVNRGLYLFFVQNKVVIMISVYAVIFSIILFIVTSNMNAKMIKITLAVDKIIKDTDKEITLPSDLAILENKLNKIRLDLIKNQNLAKESESKKNDLIMYMAHDLKTPLTSVIGYLTLLNDEKSISNNSREKYIKIALDKALRVEELTNQFFEITRYNFKSMPISMKKIDISVLLDQLIDECYPMLQDKKLECDITKPEHVYCLGDGDKLARAFGNVLKNAITYSYENTDIKISVEDNEKSIKVSLKNKGDKIPEYKLNKLFDKFYRADDSRKTNTGGTGLGLAIAKEIIELHHGKIYAKNDSDIIEFFIELPQNVGDSVEIQTTN